MTLDENIKKSSETFKVPEDKIRQSLEFLAEKEASCSFPLASRQFSGKYLDTSPEWSVRIATGLATAPDYMTDNQSFYELVRLGDAYYKDLQK
jgi:hypothetical protein